MRQREEQEHSKRAVEAAAAVTGPSPGVMGSPAGSRAAQEALDRATASARCTDTSGLESAMKLARKKGVNTRAAEARMYLASMHEEKRGKDDVAMRLQSAMERARVDNTLELETLIEVARREGVNVVSAGLVLLDLEHEKRRIEGVVATLQVQHTPSRHLVNTPHHHFF